LDDVAQTAIIAMCDPGGQYAFPPHVRWTIAQEDAGGYLAAADFIHEQGFDVASLQHEFGIYGGEAGDYILGLIAALRIPLVTTLHTVLDQPSVLEALRHHEQPAYVISHGKLIDRAQWAA